MEKQCENGNSGNMEHGTIGKTRKMSTRKIENLENWKHEKKNSGKM